MNSRAKGSRTFRKAVAYAESFPGAKVIPIYQVSMWAQNQPFDILLLRQTYMPRLVEVRTNQYGLRKPSTVALAALPGDYVSKQIWMHKDGKEGFTIREWDQDQCEWIFKENPWEGDA